MSDSLDSPDDRGLDPDLEARLVAMVLGEASEFERASLERQLANIPEARARLEELKETHVLLGDAVQYEGGGAAAWKLSPERRSRVMKALGVSGGNERGGFRERAFRDDQKVFRIQRASRRVLWAAAACLMINFVVFGWLLTRGASERRTNVREQTSITYDASASMAPEEMGLGLLPPRDAVASGEEDGRESAFLSGGARAKVPSLVPPGEQEAEVGEEMEVVREALDVAGLPSAPELPRPGVIAGKNVQPKSAANLLEGEGKAEGKDTWAGFGGGGAGGQQFPARPSPGGDANARSGSKQDTAGAGLPGPAEKAERPPAHDREEIAGVIRFRSGTGKGSPVNRGEILGDLSGDLLPGQVRGVRIDEEERYPARDETRSQLLAEVDESWEMATPPPVGNPAPPPASSATRSKSKRLGGESDDVVTRRWKVSPTFLTDLESTPEDGEEVDPFGGDVGLGSASLRPLVEILKESGISFPPGSSAQYIPSTGTVIVSNTRDNLDLMDQLLETVAYDMAQKEVGEETSEDRAGDKPFSTFSLHVSDVSFKLSKAALSRGEWPTEGQVRVEEFVNAFDYGDPMPRMADKVDCRMEQSAHPFMQQRNLLRISMRTAALGRAGGTPLAVTVLLDRSGSMERLDRAESVQRAFEHLARQMNGADVISVITFSRSPRLVVDRLRGDQAATLADRVALTPSEGGTNLEAALRAGLAKARQQRLPAGLNRVILLTDGAANLGNARPGDLARLVKEMRDSGIAFDACGVGADGLNDEILESLTRKGDGRYYFLDRPEDADSGFARQIAGALRPAAKNVKVQVHFNPRRVDHYKLYGFEKHELKREDFRDDTVDAAEMAAEEAGSAIYQLQVLPGGSGHIGSVSVRFQDMESGRMVERRWVIPYEERALPLGEAAPSMKLAGSAALLGEKLNGSAIGERVRLDELARITASLKSAYPRSTRVAELIEMTAKARDIE